VNSYTPDRWEVVKLFSEEHNVSTKKILCSWYGGYLTGDSWKLSSEISSIASFDDRHEFTTESGSRYVCYFGARGVSGIMSGIIRSIEDNGVAVEILEEYDDKS
jgi:hypothetical protein